MHLHVQVEKVMYILHLHIRAIIYQDSESTDMHVCSRCTDVHAICICLAGLRAYENVVIKACVDACTKISSMIASTCICLCIACSHASICSYKCLYLCINKCFVQDNENSSIHTQYSLGLCLCLYIFEWCTFFFLES